MCGLSFLPSCRWPQQDEKFVRAMGQYPAFCWCLGQSYAHASLEEKRSDNEPFALN